MNTIMKSGNKIGTHRWWAVLTALLTVHCSLFVSKAQAQDVTVNVNPVQQVLPPQAGQYVDNPGKFFTIRLTNNTDDEQRVHLGMHIDMLYPTEQAMVATPTDNKHIPRQPIVLAPRQTKLLNPVEMKLLFTHFELTEIYIRDGMYNDYKKGIFGLLPEGQYKLYLHCYKWDPNLTSAVLLNSPNNGTCDFNVCYTAQEPKFVTPQPNVANDPLGRFAVAKVDKALPQFTWTAPTLNCNAKFINFTYDVKVVKLNGLNPDEAIERNPVIYQRNKLTTPTLTIPTAYVNQMTMDDDVVYAMQITAVSSLSAKSNQLNFTLIENDGRSDILLFRFYDPKAEAEEAEEMEKMKVSTESGEADLDDVGESYVFEQPTLIKPVFDETTARKIYVGDDLAAEWREAWLSAGKGERKDTIKFEYTYAIYKGNSADELKNIFLSKPVYTNKTKELEAKIKWDDLDGKIKVGDYLVLRVTAAPTNGKDDIRMLGDSLNYKDFALVEHFDEDWACGTNTSEVTNKKPIAKAPKAGTKLTISDWTLEVNGDVKQDAKTKALSGTGFIHWAPSGYTIRIAVKFDKLMVNTDLVVFDGVCTSYPKEENKEKKYSAQEAVDQLFSYTGLDSFWGDLQLPENVKNKVSDEVDDVAKKLKLGEYYTYFKKKQNQWNNIKKGNLVDLYFPTELPKEVADKLPKDFSLQIASVQVSPKACVMNIIGEYVLPKSSIIDNDVLIFGAPRLCMTYDSFLPEDGVIALLSNFKIKDPSSDFTFTFKAPTHPLRPSDGCFLEWENNEFGGLGLNFAMTIPNLRRVVNGKAQDAPPIVDVKTVIGRDNDWNDWTARVTFDKFQIEDVPDWTFTPGEVIILDHSYKTNEPEMVAVADLPKTYDPSQVNSYTASNWKAWQGLYIKQVDVEFPKWGVFGSEDKGLTVGAKNMVFDNSGCTLDIFANDMMSAKTGKCGGWEFDLDKAEVSIVQNNFDKCWIEGRFAIPLFGTKKDSDNKDPNNGKVKFTCDIRHLTEGETTYYTYDKDGKKVAHTKKTYGKDKHMAYIFRVQQVGDMDWSWCAADVNIIQDHWKNELAGLLSCGVCVGNWAKCNMTLESHLFGDPTFRFAAVPGVPADLDAIVASGPSAKQLKRLSRCTPVDVRAYAMKCGADVDPGASMNLRMEKFMLSVRNAASVQELSAAIRTGLGDSYELIRRMAARYAEQCGDPALLPLLVQRYLNPLETSRVRYHLLNAFGLYPFEDLKAAFDKYYDGIWPVREDYDAFLSRIQKSRISSETEIAAIFRPGEASLKDRSMTVSAQRNACNPSAVAPMLEVIADEGEDAGLRCKAAEALGWYVYSVKREDIYKALKGLDLKDEEVADEVTRSIRRLEDNAHLR